MLSLPPLLLPILSLLVVASCLSSERLATAGQSGAQAKVDGHKLRTRRHDLPPHTQTHPNPLEELLDDSSPNQPPIAEPLQGHLQESKQTGSGSKKGNHKILYACEEKQMQIECQAGEAIQLIRSNYGRYSIQICNEHGQLDWKVNCQSPSSFKIIADSCQAKQSCQLLASNSIFGDACPGTQKYLEVHYECVPASSQAGGSNHLLLAGETAQLAANRSEHSLRYQQQGKSKSNVIFQELPSSTTSSSSSMASPSSLGSQTLSESGGHVRFPLPPPMAGEEPPALSSLAPLPPWLMEGRLRIQQPALPAGDQNGTRPACLETVWRGIRWPQTEAGHVAQMECPGHAAPASPSDRWPASLACSPEGRWAARVQAAGCSSGWLRSLAQRLQAGDSSLSLLAELTGRTRAPQTAGPTSASLQQQPFQGLFGDDLIQMARIVRRLVVEDLADFLNRIADDKQRLAYARELVQLLVELLNNLAHEIHSDAWLDLAAPWQGGSAGAGSGSLIGLQGEIQLQRLSAQLMQSLEAATVLLAGTQPPTSLGTPTMSNNIYQDQGSEFTRVTQNVYVTIRPLSPRGPSASSAARNWSLEVALPSETSTLGTKWSEQSLRLKLQAPATLNQAATLNDQLQQTSQVDVKHLSEDSGPQALKMVFLMMRPLGGSPLLATGSGPGGSGSPSGGQLGDNSANTNNNRLVVNSNLVSVSIVADSRLKYAPLKMELAEPVELVFKHLVGLNNWNRRLQRCAYWDNNISDWLSDGCKLVGTNKTHSLCACNHLTTFALLAELEAAEANPDDFHSANNPASQEQQQQQAHASLPKVQLDSVENELILPNNNKPLYLAKMLDGHLFASGQQAQLSSALLPSAGHWSPAAAPNPLRLAAYISCLLAGSLLALYLAACLYNRAQARRLLGAIPANPPPALLVANTNTLVNIRNQPPASNSEASPTYSSSIDYSAGLNAATLAGSHKAPPSRKEQSQQEARRALEWSFVVPAKLLLQLLLLQLLMVVLIESQNYLHRNRQNALLVQLAGSLSLTGSGTSLAAQALKPLGGLTWLLVLLLYYLLASVSFWLLSQLLTLNLRLAGLLVAGTEDSHTKASDKPTGGYRNGSGNLYAGQQVVGPGQASTSPTSTFSSQSIAELAASTYGQHMRHMEPGGGKRTAGGSGGQLFFVKLFSSQPIRLIDLALAEGMPVLATLLVCLLTSPQSESLNSLAYTLTAGSQLAFWPLLLELSLSLLSGLIYYAPLIFLSLFGTALFTLGRLGKRHTNGSHPRHQQQRNLGSPEALDLAPSGALISRALPLPAAAHELASSSAAAGQQKQQANPYGAGAQNYVLGSVSMDNFNFHSQQQLNKQSKCENKPNYTNPDNWQSSGNHLKEAKFLCLLLGTLSTLHLVAWSCFLSYVHQSLASWESASGWLMYAFAGSNLLFVLTLLWSQRRQFKRALQLAGLTRLLRPFRLVLLCASSGDQEQAPRFYARAADHSTLGHKVSPSNQSLFMISQQQQQQLHHQQALYGNYHLHAPTYSSGSNQQQQHLYQQLAGQQHIYDSTSGLNSLAGSAEQHAFQLRQPPQQLHQFNHQLNRSFSNLHQAQHFEQQQQLAQRGLMTLKPMVSAGFNQDCARMMVLDAQALKQAPQQQEQQPFQLQQQQQMLASNQPGQEKQTVTHSASSTSSSGEADGPLVALSSNSSGSPPATFGPQVNLQAASSSVALQQQQHFQQVTATELPLFSPQREQQLNWRGLHARTCSASGQQQPDANQHHCHSGVSYQEALKQSMLQQQQCDLHHFRRVNSKQRNNKQRHQLASMIDRVEPLDGNIYDVANYVLNN